MSTAIASRPASVAAARRPAAVTAIGVAAAVLGGMMLVGAGLLLAFGSLQGPWGNFHEFQEISFWLPAGQALAIGVLALNGTVHVVVGAGLLRGSRAAWWFALVLAAAQVVSGATQAIRGDWGQVSQAVAYAIAAGALLTPRVRAWLGSPL